MADEPTTIRDATGAVVPIASDKLATRNGVALDPADYARAQLIKLVFGTDGLGTDVTASSPLPVVDQALQAFVDGLEANTTGLATQATLAQVKTALDAINANTDGLEGFTDGIEALLGVTATSAKQDSMSTALASILAKLSGDPATQTTLAQVLAKLSSDPATQTTLAAVLSKLSADPATQTTLAAVLAKLSADPATQTTLAAVLAKLPAAPALDATVTTVASRLAAATPVNLPGASGAVTAVDGVLMGFTARETSGTAAAVFRLRAGSGTGTVLAVVSLAAAESVRDWFGPSGITATGGVYYELVSGAVAGGVQTR